MRILVTGGAGFIGSHIVDNLIDRQWEVTVVDNLTTGLERNLNKKARFIALDIRSPQITEVFQQGRFDYVIHQAAQTIVAQSLAEPLYDCDVNVLGTVNLLEACRLNGVKKIVVASSAAVYGDAGVLPIKEDSPACPSSFYGLSKLVVEKYLPLYYQRFGLEYAALRYANVYGERQGAAGEGGVVSIFIQKICADQVVDIFGDGGQTRDFIYVGDIAAANLAAVTASQPAGTYNIGTETETSINELIAILGEISGREIKVNTCPERQGDIYRSALANSTALRQLNWQVKTGLYEGLKKTYLSLAKRS